ncbi:hypothetical protein ACET3Z_015336 [Daucus carota]
MERTNKVLAVALQTKSMMQVWSSGVLVYCTMGSFMEKVVRDACYDFDSGSLEIDSRCTYQVSTLSESQSSSKGRVCMLNLK